MYSLPRTYASFAIKFQCPVMYSLPRDHTIVFISLVLLWPSARADATAMGFNARADVAREAAQGESGPL
jgi:hypothetical protein